MSQKSATALGLSLVVIAGLALGLAPRRQAEVEVSLEEVPEAARETITARAGSAEILEIERSTVDGLTVFEVEIRREGEIVEFVVGEDGAYLGLEEEDAEGDEGDAGLDDEDDRERLALTDLPALVQRAFRLSSGGAQPGAIERRGREGAMAYEIEYVAKDGRVTSTTFSESGEFVAAARAVSVDTLPESVRAALSERFPNGTVREAAAVQLFYYEVEVEEAGQTHEARVYATGAMEDPTRRTGGRDG